MADQETKKTDITATTNEIAPEELNTSEKICFIIMPIADVPTYESGHFNRVYQHLIAPACKRAGFKPIRADEVNSSNMIVLDILKKIVESDMAICDLSSRNPNVLYELGLRQAFNKKTVLIKDQITTSPFDVQAFRYAEYDSSLRIDYVQNEIVSLAASIKATYEAKDDVNSVVQLLQIEPAKIGEKTQLSTTDTIILSAIKDLTNRVDRISNFNHSTNDFINEAFKYSSSGKGIGKKSIFSPMEPLSKLIEQYSVETLKEVYTFYHRDEKLGYLADFNLETGDVFFGTDDGKLIHLPINELTLNTIIGINRG
ncbi:TPA: hypothetical protein PXP62_000877 [Yersinia enterocolitica]|uniref:hypothetical protein n=1 Tax=Yersinia enterocolitica TaxID=630 RepID=UPI00065A8C57|nr:hypothetical protein [Yersinia enterocolitica]CRY04958.1 Uncharacterised protein [Yersinia enterocolitica]HDL7690491.1 hypothetical protein [Yersinia enterocolitica]HDL7794184.1 hypothetical protein [Yersinia enterocolitica]HDL7815138.1 hypothetical protein [Yersinia enterocolitica]HDL7819480.1 hypothetical protein [Yersinia enterocolitica]